MREEKFCWQSFVRIYVVIVLYRKYIKKHQTRVPLYKASNGSGIIRATIVAKMEM